MKVMWKQQALLEQRLLPVGGNPPGFAEILF